jgi:thiamine biosynthesis lipoprotein
MRIVTLALNAMNTRFELVLHGEDAVALRAAGEEALREIARVEELLSAFRGTSEISHVNARAATEAVRVSPEVFGVLTQAGRLWELTGGAFDITVGPLMRCWGFWGAPGRMPGRSAVEAVLGSVGMQHLELDAGGRTVRFRRAGMTIDPGAIGKGYAIDQAVEILQEHGVHSGLLHGGTSTTYAIGSPPGQSTWLTTATAPLTVSGASSMTLPTVGIRNESLSVSSLSEKSFVSGGATYGHVIDPRTGWPVTGAAFAVVCTPRSVDADALSTALMVLGEAGLQRLQGAVSGFRALIVNADGLVSTAGMEGNAMRDK